MLKINSVLKGLSLFEKEKKRTTTKELVLYFLNVAKESLYRVRTVLLCSEAAGTPGRPLGCWTVLLDAFLFYSVTFCLFSLIILPRPHTAALSRGL